MHPFIRVKHLKNLGTLRNLFYVTSFSTNTPKIQNKLFWDVQVLLLGQIFNWKMKIAWDLDLQEWLWVKMLSHIYIVPDIFEIGFFCELLDYVWRLE